LTFVSCNFQGAFYGGLLAMAFVTVLGVTAQIKNTDQPFLHSSVSDCNCIVNETTSNANEFPAISDAKSGSDWFETIYKVSYIYYSMIGTLLTIFFGLLISKASDMYTGVQILKIKSTPSFHKSGFPQHGHFSVASFTLATGRKLSSFIHHVAHDVSQSTLKVENKLKEVISHTTLHHLHHGYHLHDDSEDRISILNEFENGQSDGPLCVEPKKGKMFFIGYYEGEENEIRSRRGSNSECLLNV
jgi:hypothetical protein